MKTKKNSHHTPGAATTPWAGPLEVSAMNHLGDTSPDVEAVLENTQRIEAFLAHYTAPIQRAAAALVDLRNTAEGQEARRAYEAYARDGADSKVDIADLTAGLFAKNPQLSALQGSAASYGLKGLGLGVNAEAAAIIGAQAGAEGILSTPYKIGDYMTPTTVGGRTWVCETKGLDVGLSVGLGLTLWLMPPTSSNHLLGVFVVDTPLMSTPPLGARLELFGWTPSNSDGQPDHRSVDPFKYIFGIRIVVEFGANPIWAIFPWGRVLPGFGVMKKGRQNVSGPAVQLPSYFLTPTTLATGQPTTMSGTLSHGQRAGNPSRTFTAETTMTIAFPIWMEDCINSIPGQSGTTISGLDSWTLVGASGGVLSYRWNGPDNHAWSKDIRFTLTGALSNKGAAPNETGTSTIKLTNVNSVSAVDISSVEGQAKMTLEEAVFEAGLDWGLNTDGTNCTIKHHTGTNALNGKALASTANAAQTSNNFFYIYDKTGSDPDTPPILTITYTDQNGDEIDYYIGYQFEQKSSSPTQCQIRAVFWKAGSPFLPANTYTGDWVTATAEAPVQARATFNSKISSDNYLIISATQTKPAS